MVWVGANIMIADLTSKLRSRMVGPAWLRSEQIGDGVEQIRLWTRLTHLHAMEVSLYRIGDILVDTGFRNAREPLLAHLAGEQIAIVACTHHHEDHTGNAAVIAQMNRCLVTLRNAPGARDEGVACMPRYRRWYWGEIEYSDFTEMPDVINAQRTLVPIPIPGHSVTHTALHEPATGLVFTGDLYITGGVTAVMDHENPYESIASLRRVAALDPSRMLTGHGLVVEHPARALTEKADRIEQATATVRQLHVGGYTEAQIRDRLFATGKIKDVFMHAMTKGEFCRINFVRAAIRHAPD